MLSSGLFRVPVLHHMAMKVIQTLHTSNLQNDDEQGLVDIIRCLPREGLDLSDQYHMLRQLFCTDLAGT